MEEINRLLLIANDNVRKSMQKYEDACFAFSRYELCNKTSHNS